MELANLALKRGDPRAPPRSSARGSTRSAPRRTRRATRSARSRAAPGSNACSASAPTPPATTAAAEAAWRSALIGWERLMIEHLRRKNLGESAEAAVEVGRLLYLLGRHAEGLQKFDEAIEADGDRDQTYIDVIAFLVQHGETDAALSVLSPRAVASRAAPSPSTSRSTRRCGCWTCRAARARSADAEGRGLPAHARSAPRRSAPAPRRRLVPPARPLRGRSDQLRADAGGRRHHRQARRDLLLRGRCAASATASPTTRTSSGRR